MTKASEQITIIQMHNPHHANYSNIPLMQGHP